MSRTDIPPEMARLERSILSGLSRARSGGGSFPAQFSGLSYEAVGDGECTVGLSPAPQVLDRDGSFSAAAIAVLCDYSLSGATRSRVGRESTTPTVTLQIECGSWPFPRTDIVCRSVFHGWLGKMATATASLETTAGARLGTAYGRFLVQQRTTATGFARYPWEGISEPLTLTQLTAAEQQARSFLLSRAAAGTTEPDNVLSYEQLYGIVADEAASPDSVQLRQPTGPHLANRSGLVHGGVTAGLLVNACLRAAATGSGSGRRILTSTCTFLRPGRIDQGDLLARAEVVFDGRRLSCVAGEVTDSAGRCLMRGEILLSEPGETPPGESAAVHGGLHDDRRSRLPHYQRPRHRPGHPGRLGPQPLGD